MEALQFPRGNYYQIICKAGDQALKVQESDPSKYEKSRIVGSQPNIQDNSQLFMIQKIGLKDDQFQFVSCPAALVFDQDGKQIRLRSGKQSGSQLFAVVQAPIQAFHKYFWIKTDSKGHQALSLQGILRYGAFDPNNESQLFRFELVNNQTIQSTAILINNFTGKALDVPGGTWKKGERLVQWEKNKRWNQRWRFVKTGKGVVIQSLFNNLALDIAEQKRDNGAKVVQWDKTGGSNQQWFPEPAGNGIFKFRSCHEPSLFLAIKKQKVDNGGELQVCNEENPSMYWRVEGALP